LNTKTKIYFASDFHLGTPSYEASRIREDKIIRWLDMVSVDAKEIFLVGDIFDFWFEYKAAIPKGFVRFQGKIANLVDAGIKVHFFIGNHDMWMFDYFPKELGIIMHRKEQEFEFFGKKVFIGHGDGLGPGDKGYKFIKKVFASPFLQWMFARLHPNLGIGIANYWSRKSRAKDKEPQVFLGEEKEWLVQYCKEISTQQKYEFMIFGHRHLPIEFDLENGGRYINLGDWLNHFTYGVLDEEGFNLNKFETT